MARRRPTRGLNEWLLVGAGLVLLAVAAVVTPSTPNAPAPPLPVSIGAECPADDTPCRVAAWTAAVETRGLEAVIAIFDATVDETSVYDTDCHTISHALGSAAYERAGRDIGQAAAIGSLECSGGMVHGAVIRAMIEQQATGPTDLEAIARRCLAPDVSGSSWEHQRQCIHGMGHGLVAIGGPIEAALRGCDEIEIAEWPEAATVCGDGAIMEAFDPFIDGHATLLVRPDGDVMTPCLEFEDPRYAADCAYYAIRQATRPDFVAGLARCDALPDEIRDACLRGAGADGWGSLLQLPDEVRRACATFRDPSDCRARLAFGVGEIVHVVPEAAEAYCVAVADAGCLGAIARGAGAATNRSAIEHCNEAPISDRARAACRATLE
jgi:hypothetical protein